MIDISLFLHLVNTFGLLGVFLSTLIGSATIFLPLPSFAFVVIAGSFYNPFLVGIVAGIGSAIGELTGYAVGYGAVRIKYKHKNRQNKVKHKNWLSLLQTWFDRKLGFLLIVVFAATPLPDDIIGIFCGAIRYDIRKFFAATLIGKLILFLALAYAGFYGMEFLSGYFL